MLRPAARPASIHYEIQDGSGALVGSMLFSCPLYADTIAKGIRAAIPTVGTLAIVEVSEQLVATRTVKQLSRAA